MAQRLASRSIHSENHHFGWDNANPPVLTVAPGESRTLRMRLTNRAPAEAGNPLSAEFDAIFQQRRQEADAFYAALTPAALNEDAARNRLLYQRKWGAPRLADGLSTLVPEVLAREQLDDVCEKITVRLFQSDA